MIAMKHIIITLWAAFLLVTVGAKAQEPTITFDGVKLIVSVPSGYLEFNQDEIGNQAIADCFAWNDRNCLFIAQPDAYVFKPKGLSTDETISLKGTFDGTPVIINVKMVEAPVVKTPESCSNEGAGVKFVSNNLIFIVLGVFVAVLLVVILVLRKKKRPQEPQIANDPNIISVINDESVKYERGLSHVKERLGDYLVFDMDIVFADTTINKVYFHTDLIKKLYDFFNNSLEADGRTNETGCFIVGCWDFEEGRRDRYDISLEYMVKPGDDADFGEYSLNFGKKISINMASVIDDLSKKSNRDYVLTCWMHSHPGLGLFLSNQDLIVQQQLTYSDHRNRLIAIVIDTNTPDFKVGFFTAKNNGKMNNKEEVKHWFSFEEIYRQSRELSRNQPLKNPSSDTTAFNPDCFNIALNDNEIAKLGFTPHAVNQIGNAIYSGTKGVIGYLYGELEEDYQQVSCCLPYENEEKMGCLIFGDNLTESQLGAYASDLSGCRFFINGTTDDKLMIWTRNDHGGFSPVGETSLMQMKEWIRRKRV